MWHFSIGLKFLNGWFGKTNIHGMFNVVKICIYMVLISTEEYEWKNAGILDWDFTIYIFPVFQIVN